jgi:hypothetical protein
MMSALMSDVVDGSVNPATANAAVNAGGKLLKAVELQLKYGRGDGKGGTLHLTGPQAEAPAAPGQRTKKPRRG